MRVVGIRMCSVNAFVCSLSQVEIVTRLLDFITTEPAGADEKARFKYPNLACEILASGSWQIVDALVKPECQAKLWGVLDVEGEMHPLLGRLV